ncbi:hypothetical protein FS827_22435 [Agrobacterium vitis]|uniref:hypothetical protein n=1 Tax=Rhizobium/Agrobacterium group TaxID=227290 RepID=UPI0015D91986|nr:MULTISPECIES: hypothetical protein [Rhizobium/Agrobacterium group]MCF1464066.1 hypothetical protein [Allorhizobium ampelinum]BCH60816.1 hypothetical protein RvVAR0630_34400 [Agrobacterium vitis]
MALFAAISHRLPSWLTVAVMINLIATLEARANEVTVAQALDVCRSATVQEATQMGDLLGWPRMPEDKNWKSSYETYNKVTVEVVGWRDETAGSSLSFWIAKGVNPGKACNYSPTNKDTLLADMKAVLGPPQDEDHNEIVNTAYWRLPNAEIYFTKVGSTSSFTMSDRK